MSLNFQETNHPLFTSSSALNRGIVKQTKGKTSTHFNAEMTNSELLFKIIFSATQLSMCGAVACWCYHHGAKEDEEAGNPSVHEENVNKGLMNSVTGHEVSYFGVNSKTDGSSGKLSEQRDDNDR